MKDAYFKNWPTQPLNKLLILNQSGIWGDEGTESDYPVLRSTNIREGKLVLDDVAYRKIDSKEVQKYLLEDGDIIVTKSSGSAQLIGKCCIFTKKDNKKYLFSNFTQRLRVNKTMIDPYFLFYYLTSPLGKAVLSRINNTTSGLRNLNMRDYSQQAIPAPPLPIQRNIISVLDKCESARAKRKEANRLTDEFIKSVFLDMFGDPVRNNKDWYIDKIENICSAESGGTPSTNQKEYWEDGNIPWLSSTCCRDDFVRGATAYITKEGLENSSAKIFKKKTVLVALVGATIGKTGFLTFDSTTNQNIVGLYPRKGSNIVPEYLFFAMQFLYPRFLALSRSGFKMANLTFVRNLIMPFEEELNNLFNSLMQKAFKGELS